jgi:hypothetical protein
LNVIQFSKLVKMSSTKELEEKGKDITGLHNVKIDTKRMELILTTEDKTSGMYHGYNLPFRGWIHKDNYSKRFHPSHSDFLEDESPKGIDCLCDVSKFLQELNLKYCCI